MPRLSSVKTWITEDLDLGRSIRQWRMNPEGSAEASSPAAAGRGGRRLRPRQALPPYSFAAEMACELSSEIRGDNEVQHSIGPLGSCL